MILDYCPKIFGTISVKKKEQPTDIIPCDMTFKYLIRMDTSVYSIT